MCQSSATVRANISGLTRRRLTLGGIAGLFTRASTAHSRQRKVSFQVRCLFSNGFRHPVASVSFNSKYFLMCIESRFSQKSLCRYLGVSWTLQECMGYWGTSQILIVSLSCSLVRIADSSQAVKVDRRKRDRSDWLVVREM